MQRISSNMTLVYKIFFPTFWYIFMGLLTIYVLFSDPETTPLFANQSFKIIFLILYILFGLLIYFACITLMRMEASSDGFYISNFFKTYKYKYEDIESIKLSKLLFFKFLRIKMKSKTTFGHSFKILYKEVYWLEFIEEHKELKRLIISK